MQAVYAALEVRGYEHRSMRLGEGSVIVRLDVKDQNVCCPGCGALTFQLGHPEFHNTLRCGPYGFRCESSVASLSLRSLSDCSSDSSRLLISLSILW